MRTCVLFLVCPLPCVLCSLPRLTVLLPALPDVHLSAQREVQVQPPVRLPLGDRGHIRLRDTPHRLKSTRKQFNFSLNQILPTLFTLRDDESKIIAVMSSNVDDLLYGYLQEGAEAMNSVLQQFLVGKEEHKSFRFCGKEVQQDEHFGIHVTVKDNTERVQPITLRLETFFVTKGCSRRYTSIEIRHTISCLDRKANTA